jgi:hypothetical protein
MDGKNKTTKDEEAKPTATRHECDRRARNFNPEIFASFTSTVHFKPPQPG